jgi:DNA-binding transcriptional regulator YdaS (Cro superfamily)
MKLHDWLKEESGRASAMAAHFGVHRSFISQWRVGEVPVKYMRGVVAYTGGAVTLNDLIPMKGDIAPVQSKVN